MQKFLILLIIWNLITFIYYWLGKLSIRNLSEQKLTEIITSPLFKSAFSPKHRVLHWSVLFILILSFFVIIGGSLLITPYLSQLQIALFNTSNGIFIEHDFFLFHIVTLGLLTASILILILFIMRYRPEIPTEKWYTFPSFEAVKQQIRIIRNWAFAINSLLLLALFFGMYDYTIFNKNVYIHNPIDRFTEEIIPYKNLKNVHLTYDYKRERSGKSTTIQEDLLPRFWILTKTDSFNIWHSSLNIKNQKLEKITQRLVENQVPIDLNYPGIIEKYTWRADYKKQKFERVIAVYDYVNRLKKGLLEPIKIGQIVSYNDLIIRLDSAIFTNRNHVFKAQTEQLLTYFTIANITDKKVYFGTLSDLKAIDETNHKTYSLSVLIDNTSDGLIPPKQTLSVIQGFDIPNTSKFIKINYQPSILENEFITFEIKF